MPRPRFTKKERSEIFEKDGNPHGQESCWHCGSSITLDNFHVDHFPVTYKDIENQVCIGVTDPKMMSNLVPSCPRCNTSHKFESNAWCGRSQVRCTMLCIYKCTAAVCAVTSLALALALAILLFENGGYSCS